MAFNAGTPPTVADLLALQAATTQRPLVRLQQMAAQSLASNTATAITFGASSEEIDTHGFHDTASNTSRITPTLAGYYRFTGTVWYAADTDVISYFAMLAKNGSIFAPRNEIVLPSTATSSLPRSANVTAIQAANGTSDYFELLGQQLQAAAGSLNTNIGGSLSSLFECEYLRPL
ncbi:hypothetical protein Ade02nite_19870 [Paractinoplanes deccanensis]|uniref:C1q domain-containing protein n=1 Tax=Paractinoplanes deccanensis TaxID=113561 RepID=A0ABQ3Y021_9ACTN|nr:hypothetical protein [Actinoplanes deccanensis]GID73346.1 hypothetical protein Ade02nite_19870 [Actinoplanes deccanensis]